MLVLTASEAGGGIPQAAGDRGTPEAAAAAQGHGFRQGRE